MNASECWPPHTSTRFFGRSGNRYGSVIVLCKSPHERPRVTFLGRMLRMSGLFNELEGVRTYLPVYCLALAEIQYRCYGTPNPKLLAIATARASRLGSLEERAPKVASCSDCSAEIAGSCRFARLPPRPYGARSSDFGADQQFLEKTRATLARISANGR